MNRVCYSYRKDWEKDPSFQTPQKRKLEREGKVISLFKKGLQSPFGAAAVGGAVETTLFYWTVIVGLSKQLKQPLPNTLTGYYKGYGTNLLVMVPTFTTLLGVNSHLKKGRRNQDLSLLVLCYIAGVSAFVASLCTNPLEVLTVRQRLNPSFSMRRWAREVKEKEGLRAFYRGLIPGSSRFFLYSFGVNAFPTISERNLTVYAPSYCETPEQKTKLLFWMTLLGGSLAGIASQPLHVINALVKSKMDQISSLQIARNLWAIEGYRAFFRGGAARLVRTGPGGAVVITVMNFLQKKEGEL